MHLVIEAGLAPQSIYTKCTFRHIGGEREAHLGADDPACPRYNRVCLQSNTPSQALCALQVKRTVCFRYIEFVLDLE